MQTQSHNPELCELYFQAVSNQGLDSHFPQPPEGYDAWLQEKMSNEAQKERLDEYAKKLLNGDITEEEYLQMLAGMDQQNMATVLERGLASLMGMHQSASSQYQGRMDALNSFHQNAFNAEVIAYQKSMQSWVERKASGEAGGQQKSGGFWTFGKKSSTPQVEEKPKEPSSLEDRIKADPRFGGIQKGFETMNERAASASEAIRRLQRLMDHSLNGDQDIDDDDVHVSPSPRPSHGLPDSKKEMERHTQDLDDFIHRSSQPSFTFERDDAEMLMQAKGFAESMFFNDRLPESDEENTFLERIQKAFESVPSNPQNRIIDQFVAWVKGLINSGASASNGPSAAP